jgi:SAM-dependent methyltransferase
MDDIAERNRRHWENNVRQGVLYTQPWLDLDVNTVTAFAQGEIDRMSDPYVYIYPQCVFRDVGGKKVLCLASGGGQQTAVFGLLGADVTVLDLTEGQLDGDRQAAEFYGYDVRIVKGDMRDLSVFRAGEFDVVYQAISACFVPDVRPVYSEVARILRAGGIYRVAHCNPTTQEVEATSWDGSGSRIPLPCVSGQLDDDDVCEYRHLFSQSFNGLIDSGFTIKGVWEDPRHLTGTGAAEPGTDDHMFGFIQKYFAIVACRNT